MSTGTLRPSHGRRPTAGFTLVELLVSITVTAIVAASVVTTISAVRVGLDDQGESAQETARLARAQARLSDHLYRARMILQQGGGVATLWVPAESLDGTESGAAEFDAIHRNEIRWYAHEPATGTIVMQRTADRADRAELPLATDWAALRVSLEVAGDLERTVVLTGVDDAEFRAGSFDPCEHRRLALDVQLDGSRGGTRIELGGILGALQRHASCP